MSWGSGGTIGWGTGAGLSNIWLRTDSAAYVGDVVLLFVTTSNSSYANGSVSTTYPIISDVSGNSWSRVGGYSNQGACLLHVFMTRVSTQIDNWDRIDISLGSTPDLSTVSAHRFTVASNSTVTLGGVTGMAVDGALPGSLSTSSGANYLAVRAMACQAPASDVLYGASGWFALDRNYTTNSGIYYFNTGEYRIVSSGAVTSNPTGFVADWTSLLFVLYELLPTISVGNISVQEGNTAQFSVSINNAAAGSTLSLTLTPISATEGVDYKTSLFQYSLNGGSTWSNATEGSAFSVNSGNSTVLVRTDTFDDTIDEPNETFTLACTLNSGSTTLNASATATIIDNDEPMTGVLFFGAGV